MMDNSAGSMDAPALLEAARLAAARAYAPYSNFPVGAALLTLSGEVLTGVNVENASYGLTLCAERSALVRAIGEGHRYFQAMAVYADSHPHGAVTPCGACRQVMAEFMSGETPIIMADKVGNLRELPLQALLPEAFGSPSM